MGKRKAKGQPQGATKQPSTEPSAKKQPARKRRQRRRPVLSDSLHVTSEHAAGIDIHQREHWVAVPPGSPPPLPKDPKDHPANVPAHVRCFRTNTADLEELADWLTTCGVTTIAMESTGIYHIALFELLERRGFEVYLVDPRQTKHVPGRPKTDVHDCQWIQRLHSYGLLSAAFRPADQVVVLRGYLRQRQMLLSYGGQHIQHMQKALEQMNVKLGVVVSDVTGVTGMAIIKAILAGERDPLKLAKLRNEKCKHSEAEIARALYGTWRAEHLFELKQAVALYEFYQARLRECDRELEAHLRTFEDKSGGEILPPRLRRYKHPANDPHFEVRPLLHQMSGVDLTVLEGIDDSTALTILSEIGTDMSKFPTEKHFTSWLGLSPQHQSSAGKIRSRHVRRGANRAARAFRLAGQGCHHAKNALGAFYRRIQSRSGGGKAVVATARKIATRVYRLLKYGLDYVRQDMDAYEEAYRLKLIKGLARKAQLLGYRLEPAMTP
jgi:transposase